MSIFYIEEGLQIRENEAPVYIRLNSWHGLWLGTLGTLNRKASRLFKCRMCAFKSHR